jgi:hypothetical protein
MTRKEKIIVIVLGVIFLLVLIGASYDLYGKKFLSNNIGTNKSIVATEEAENDIQGGLESTSSANKEIVNTETTNIKDDNLSQNAFSFGIQGDSHPERAGKMFNSDLYKTTLQNVAKVNPAFYFLLGDDFSIEKLIENKSYTQQTVDEIYLNQKKYLDALSMPKYLVNGNHEQEAKYLLDGTNTNPAVLARTARAKFFDSPGSENGYYSFTYGNALFIVIDFYWNSDTVVDNTAGAKNTEDKKQRDLWNNTLGDVQYNWFKQTLENSNAKYKFVFTHHVLGTGRGGIEQAKLYEWGGYNQQGVWEFDKKRPGWELPVHQLMVKNGVTIFFQGHDHLFAKQELDGIIYQEVPNPADDTYTAFNKDAYKTGDILPNSGFLDVTVSADQVKVDYIKSGQSNNGQSIYSYTTK